MGVATRTYGYNPQRKDQLTANGSYPLTYDASANLKTYADGEYEWEAGRQLVKQTQNEKVVSYDYDYNGMRIRQTVSNKTSGYALLHQLLVIWKLKESHTVGIEKRHGQ